MIGAFAPLAVDRKAGNTGTDSARSPHKSRHSRLIDYRVTPRGHRTPENEAPPSRQRQAGRIAKALWRVLRPQKVRLSPAPRKRFRSGNGVLIGHIVSLGRRRVIVAWNAADEPLGLFASPRAARLAIDAAHARRTERGVAR
jgi:hypothetical protein